MVRSRERVIRRCPEKGSPMKMMKKLAAVLFFSFLLVPVPPAAAQEIEDPGPHLVGWSDVQFVDQYFGCGNVNGRVYYPALAAGKDTPADPGSGPYPLVAFAHGWLGRPSNYDDLCTHIVSWGFVVASIGTETGFFATMQQEALDTQAFLHWMEDESGNAAGPFFDLLDGGNWGASGHSMGGGCMMYLLGYEARVRTVIPLQPYRGSGLGGSSGSTAYLNAFDGSLLIVAGDMDTTCPWDTTAQPYFEDADSAARNFAHLVHGMGHLGPCDDNTSGDPLPPAEQHRLHRRLVTGFLRAEMKGEENLYIDMLGEGMSLEPVSYRSATVLPPLWADESGTSPGNLAIGLAGTRGARACLAWSILPANIPTPYGTLGLDLSAGACFYDASLPIEGLTEQLLPVQPSWIGQDLYLQGLLLGGGQGMLTRTATVVPQ